MARASRLRILYLTHLSTPATDRIIYGAIHRGSVRRILEVGLGLGQRALRMIEVAGYHAAAREIHFTGVDPFEDRAAGDVPGLSLRMAYRLLRPTGARVQLLPGEPFTALSRAADRLAPMDLLVISAGQNGPSMHRAWFYLPRLMHRQSLVFVESRANGNGLSVERVDWLGANRRAIASVVRRAA